MKILIYDVHASESGALAILDDLYKQIVEYEDKSIEWTFVVSTPKYTETKNIKVLRFPWTKKSWFHRFLFDNITTRKILIENKPEIVFSLQNKGIYFYKGVQFVYLHLPFVLTDYKVNIRRDGKKLWAYKNILSKMIFRSLRKVDKTIVQTQWMKDGLVDKAGINEDKVVIIPPDISQNDIRQFIDSSENRKKFFYPATAFTYKNHMTILKACKYIQQNGHNDYEVVFTIKGSENAYAEELYKYSKDNQLNVKFNGSIPREQVFDMYTKSVLLFPSFIESFGLPLLEARLSNCFIIAGDMPFSREILNGYANTNYFSGSDYKLLGKYMVSIPNMELKCVKSANFIDKKRISLINLILNNSNKK